MQEFFACVFRTFSSCPSCFPDPGAEPVREEVLRFLDVFARLGYPVNPPVVKRKTLPVPEVFGPKKGRWVGLAPFTTKLTKMYPLDSAAEVVRRLLSADTIYVLGLRSAMPLAMFLAYYLDYICGNVVTFSANIQDLRETMVRMDHRDAFICISFPRYSTRTAEAMAYAKSRGARTIALTDKLDSPIGAMADVVLLAKSDMASFADSLTAPLSVINAIIVAAGLQSENEVQEHLRELENVWNRDQVYLTDGGDGR